MAIGTLSLVLLSAVLHASWNFLLKRAGGTQVVMSLSKVAEVAVFAPAFLLAFAPALPSVQEAVWWAGIGSIGVAANYVALSRAYRLGDLSFVYPIARGAILVFLPLSGWLFLGEHLSPLGATGLGVIIGGIVVLNLEGFGGDALRRLGAALTGRATLYALLSGLIAAVFTVWDKRAILRLAPFAYMWLYTFFASLAFATWLVRRAPRDEVQLAWREHRWRIVTIGVLNTSSYLLVLFALRTGVTSYVLGMRQLSIAGGVALGWKFLREPLTTGRLVGVALILSGCLLLSVAAMR